MARRGPWLVALILVGAMSLCSVLRVVPVQQLPTTRHPTVASKVAKVVIVPPPPTQLSSFPTQGDRRGSGNKFTICMLSYRAPLSLQYALRSLARYGLLRHPDLIEVIVYFQAFNKIRDTAVVSAVLEGIVPYRVIGSPDNMAVAKATFVLIRAVKTPYVLYLECDRPIVARSPDDAATTRVVANRVTAALGLLSSGAANLVRMQIYASGDLRDADLRPDTYGHSPTVASCAAAPSFTKEECLQSKKTKGHTFYTAYCKHWWKFRAPTKFVDMCDSFCFLEWVAGGAIPKVADKHRLVRGITSGEETMYCLPSYLCNWTNQPAMYSVEWYVKNVIGPCEQEPGECFGKSGRGSAVRQEVFLSQNRIWGVKNHTICVNRGLFFHNEIDNREASAPKF